MLRALADTFGGPIYRSSRATETIAEAYRWQVCGPLCVPILRRILPRLLLKRELAELVLELYHMLDAGPQRTNGHSLWTPEMLRRGQEMALRSAWLNRTGPRDDVSAVVLSVDSQLDWLKDGFAGK